MRKIGIPRGQVFVQTYSVGVPDASAPIRVSYMAMRASAGPCGRWPEDILKDDANNKHYADFGCSYQHNLAAQIANPVRSSGAAQTDLDRPGEPRQRVGPVQGPRRGAGLHRQFGSQLLGPQTSGE